MMRGTWWAVAVVGAVLAACSNSSTSRDAAAGGSGGSAATAGASGKGGAAGTGGASAAGGTGGGGGAAGSGGAAGDAGGAAGTAGTVGAGGVGGSAGAGGSGGAAGRGGVSGTGGAAGNAGVSGTGGAAGRGGTGGATGGAAGGSGGATGGSGGAASCSAGTGFGGTPLTWALPTKSGYSFYDGLDATSNCPAYATVDMTGDGRPDLVVTADCPTTGTVGVDHWLLYLNTGSGFATTPMNWPLPAKSGYTFSNGLNATSNCPAYATVDMTGEGRPDLVVTADCATAGTVGLDHWVMYLNSGSGFSMTPINWPLPTKSGYSFTGGLSATSNCPAYTTVDMTGEGRPDLVVTADCPTTGTVGTDHWVVYLNTGSGFGTNPLTWALPTKSGYNFTNGLYATSNCPAYATTDVTGDGRPDLVVTADCPTTGTVGMDHWVVYLNTSNGFGMNPLCWTLPVKSGYTFYDGLSATSNCPAYARSPMTGSGRPDLVVTADCPTTGTVGLDHWLVYISSH